MRFKSDDDMPNKQNVASAYTIAYDAVGSSVFVKDIVHEQGKPAKVEVFRNSPENLVTMDMYQFMTQFRKFEGGKFAQSLQKLQSKYDRMQPTGPEQTATASLLDLPANAISSFMSMPKRIKEHLAEKQLKKDAAGKMEGRLQNYNEGVAQKSNDEVDAAIEQVLSANTPEEAVAPLETIKDTLQDNLEANAVINRSDERKDAYETFVGGVEEWMQKMEKGLNLDGMVEKVEGATEKLSDKMNSAADMYNKTLEYIRQLIEDIKQSIQRFLNPVDHAVKSYSPEMS